MGKEADIDVMARLFSKPLLFDMPPILVSTVDLAVEQLRYFGERDAHSLLKRQLAMILVTQVYELMSEDRLQGYLKLAGYHLAIFIALLMPHWKHLIVMLHWPIFCILGRVKYICFLYVISVNHRSSSC